MSDFHFAPNMSSAGTLLYAVKQKMLSGVVEHAMDSLDAGPLTDGFARAAFWQEIDTAAFPPGNSNPVSYDAFAPWQKMREAVNKTPPDRIVIWASNSGSDYVFLRMSCRMLADIDIPLFHVAVPPKDGYHSVAVHSAEELAPMISHARRLAKDEREALAQEFDSIAARPESLRECDENGRLIFRQLGDHDGLIIAALSTEWRRASHVIGEAMGNSDPRNGAGDAMLAARLRYLIETGAAEEEYRAEPRTWRNWHVRLKK